MPGRRWRDPVPRPRTARPDDFQPAKTSKIRSIPRGFDVPPRRHSFARKRLSKPTVARPRRFRAPGQEPENTCKNQCLREGRLAERARQFLSRVAESGTSPVCRGAARASGGQPERRLDALGGEVSHLGPIAALRVDRAAELAQPIREVVPLLEVVAQSHYALASDVREAANLPDLHQQRLFGVPAQRQPGFKDYVRPRLALQPFGSQLALCAEIFL